MQVRNPKLRAYNVLPVPNLHFRRYIYRLPSCHHTLQLQRQEQMLSADVQLFSVVFLQESIARGKLPAADDFPFHSLTSVRR